MDKKQLAASHHRQVDHTITIKICRFSSQDKSVPQLALAFFYVPQVMVQPQEQQQQQRLAAGGARLLSMVFGAYITQTHLLWPWSRKAPVGNIYSHPA